MFVYHKQCVVFAGLYISQTVQVMFSFLQATNQQLSDSDRYSSLHQNLLGFVSTVKTGTFWKAVRTVVPINNSFWFYLCSVYASLDNTVNSKDGFLSNLTCFLWHFSNVRWSISQLMYMHFKIKWGWDLIIQQLLTILRYSGKCRMPEYSDFTFNHWWTRTCRGLFSHVGLTIRSKENIYHTNWNLLSSIF